MSKIKNIFLKFGIISELFAFLWQKKRWWMIPLVIVLIIIALILIFSQGSVLGPFIYSLF